MTTWRYATFDGDMSEEELSFQEEKLLRASLQSKKPIDTAPPPATSQYSSSRNAAINLARKQRREIQRATNSRDPEPRSLRTQATPPLPPKAGTTTAAAGASTAHPRNSFISRGTVSSAHDSLHLSTRSPPPLVQPPLPPSAAEETAALTAHAVATVRSTPTVPAPQPPSLAPEVCTMEPGKVRGTTEWLQKHASVRRLENAKPEQMVEVHVLAPGTKDHWMWVAAMLEGDHGGRGRSYVLLESDEWVGNWNESHKTDDAIAKIEELGIGEDDDDNESRTMANGEKDASDREENGGGSCGSTASSATTAMASTAAAASAPPSHPPPKSVLIPRHEQRTRVRRMGSAGVVYARARCYMCGRECGIASLPFHHQKCLLKWDARVALPSRFTCELNDPRGLPTCPGPDLDAYNARALEVYETAVKPKCPGCLLPFAPSSLISHAKECLKPRPQLLAHVLAKFGPDGYQPLGAKLIGGKRCKPKHVQTIAGPGTISSSSRSIRSNQSAPADNKRAPRLGHSGVTIAPTSSKNTAAAAVAVARNTKVATGAGVTAARGAGRIGTTSSTTREQSSSRLATWNGSGDYRERPSLQQATAFRQLFRPKQRPNRKQHDDGASREFWEFTAETGKAFE